MEKVDTSTWYHRGYRIDKLWTNTIVRTYRGHEYRNVYQITTPDGRKIGGRITTLADCKELISQDIERLEVIKQNKEDD